MLTRKQLKFLPLKKLLLPILIVAGSFLLIARLFYLQIYNDTFKLKAQNNAIKAEYYYPERGRIFDRSGKLLVANQISYVIMVAPNEIRGLDTLRFCRLLGVTKTYFLEKIAKAKVYSPRLPSLFLAQLEHDEIAAFEENLRKFKGFYFQKRQQRKYEVDYGANIFGFITQADDKLIGENSYYKSGDLIGRQGVEQTYEKALRGLKE